MNKLPRHSLLKSALQPLKMLFFREDFSSSASSSASLVRQAKPGFSTELKSEQHDKKVSNM
jgi:hypothetical protein